MFDTSNCCKFSLVGQLQFSPEVDFRFFFQDRRSIKYLVFTTQIDKNIFQALFLTENFTKKTLETVKSKNGSNKLIFKQKISLF